MDYLDTFDVDSTHKKCHRVRSWYLYEQYKTLEKNQLDAAQSLKSKSYQNSILRQELKERRARRKLCDQYGLCQRELTLDRTIQSCPSASTDDLFESLCELHKEYEDDQKDNVSCDGSQTSKNDDNNEVENKIDDFSDSESIQSVIDNVIIKENVPRNVKEELEIVKKNIAKNIRLQLETVKENMECLEMFTKHNEDSYFRENSNIEDLKDSKKFKNKTQNIFESLFSIWSNLVVFASNSIQLYPGNCYSQFSSQLLTAVLVCDFLRKSVDGMCHILQSYVSPIKFATSDSENSLFAPEFLRNCGCSRKKIDNYEKTHKSIWSKFQKYKNNFQHCSCDRYKPKTFERRCYSENKSNSNYLSDNRINERICRGASEPWRSTCICENKNGGKHSRKTFSNFRNFFNKNHCNCKDIANSSLQVARYIDKILQDVEETPLWL